MIFSTDKNNAKKCIYLSPNDFRLCCIPYVFILYAIAMNRQVKQYLPNHLILNYQNFFTSISITCKLSLISQKFKPIYNNRIKYKLEQFDEFLVRKIYNHISTLE